MFPKKAPVKMVHKCLFPLYRNFIIGKLLLVKDVFINKQTRFSGVNHNILHSLRQILLQDIHIFHEFNLKLGNLVSFVLFPPYLSVFVIKSICSHVAYFNKFIYKSVLCYCKS